MLKKISFIVFSLVLIFGSISVTQAVSEVGSREPRFRERLMTRDIMDTFCDRFTRRFFVSIFCQDDPAGPVCGNEVQEEGEECDGTAGVGENQMCSNECELVDLPFCGDGMINQPTEDCDGTAGVGEHEMCSNQCEIVNLPFCGDNTINQLDEECDGTAGVGEHQMCSNQCEIIDLPFCGDGVVNQESEQCDGTAGVGEHQMCNNQCELVNLPFCGDGVVNQPEEECDGTAGVGVGQICSNQCLLEELPPAGVARVVINEVLPNPSETQGGDAHEWVELFNAGNATADLTGWSLKDSAGAPDVLPGSPMLEPGKFAVISDSPDLPVFWTMPADTLVIESGIGAGLNNGGDYVSLINSSAVIVDTVSYGDNTEAFSPSVGLPGDGESISRSPNGVDTNTAADWVEMVEPSAGF